MDTNDHPRTSLPRSPLRRAVQARPAPIPLTGLARPGGQGTVLGCAPEPPPAPLRWYRSPVLDDEQAAAGRAPGAVPDDLASRIWCAEGAEPHERSRRVRHIALVRVARPLPTGNDLC